MKQRTLKCDGVYFISPKENPNLLLTVTQQSTQNGATLSFEPNCNHWHQYFYIKHHQNYYTIMPINSHLNLGVFRKEDHEYEGSKIRQNTNLPTFLVRWNLIFDREFIFELSDSEYCMQFTSGKNLQLSKKKANENSQKFLIQSRQFLSSGLYYIKPIVSSRERFITVNKNFLGNSNNAYVTESDNKLDQLFYVIHDSADGCFSIINVRNKLCLSTGANPSNFSSITQEKFYNLDYQKWFVGSNVKSSLISHKSTQFILSNHSKQTADLVSFHEAR